MLIDVIPLGKKHKQTRQQLMYKLKMTDEKQFKRELSELRKKYIIISDNGYYVPSSVEEYAEFIEKQKKILVEAQNTLRKAQKEMEEL